MARDGLLLGSWKGSLMIAPVQYRTDDAYFGTGGYLPLRYYVGRYSVNEDGQRLTAGVAP